MTRSGVSHFIADRVLGHVIPGVQGVYDRYDYLKEKREALSVLASALVEIVKGRPARTDMAGQEDGIAPILPAAAE